MAALVENMFYTGREKPWHGLGVQVENATTSAEAIKLAGLDWEVKSEFIYDAKGNAIPGYRANVRSSDNSVLGVVSPKYKIVQNKEAFEFTDNLISSEVKYETAGSLKDGKQVWLLAKMPDTNILGDKIEPYICFTNTHDGSGAIRVCMTPIRVVCNNTLNFALNTAKRSWSTRHMGDMQGKLIEARETLGLANIYMEELNKKAIALVDKKMTSGEIEQTFDSIYIIDQNTTERQIKNIMAMKENFYKCLAMPDIAKFKGTAYGTLMAATDMADHLPVNRMTQNYQENNWSRIIVGHPFVDKIYEKVAC